MVDQPIMGGWHLQKNVSVGHIITTVVVAISAVFWMSQIQAGVERNSAALSRIVEAVDTHIISGPHGEAAVRLARLEVITQRLIEDSRENQKLLRKIGSDMRNLKHIEVYPDVSQ